MAAASLTFRQLIDAVRRAGIPAHERPRPMSWVADKCGLSTSYLYVLVDGGRVARSWTVARIAMGLGISKPRVQRALDLSREAAEVVS